MALGIAGGQHREGRVADEIPHGLLHEVAHLGAGALAGQAELFLEAVVGLNDGHSFSPIE